MARIEAKNNNERGVFVLFDVSVGGRYDGPTIGLLP